VIVVDTAQMLIPGPETGHGYHPGWIVHNDDTSNEVYMDVTPAIVPVPGSSHFIVPPGTAIAVTGSQTFWAMCAPGKTAAVHTVPSATFGAPGATGPGVTVTEAG